MGLGGQRAAGSGRGAGLGRARHTQRAGARAGGAARAAGGALASARASRHQVGQAPAALGARAAFRAHHLRGTRFLYLFFF